MNYTENYRLNQWDAEDRILREDFNRDNANVESGLTDLKQGLETETQNREAAVTAAKQEAAQAVAAAKQEASDGLAALESSKADKTVLAQLQALVDAMPFVKLRAVTVSEAVNQVDVDMRDVSLSSYSYLVIVPRLTVDEDNSMARYCLRINGVADESYQDISGSQKYLFSCYGIIYGNYFSRFEMMEVDREIRVLRTTINSDEQASVSTASISRGIVPAEQMETINFVGENGALIQPGGEIQIYGVKR